MKFIQQSKKGFALSIVLWIVAALLFGIATIASYSKSSQNITSQLISKLETQLIANDILEYTKFYIMTADFDFISFHTNLLANTKYNFPSRLIVDNRWYLVSKNVKLRLLDLTGAINVNKTSPDLIAKYVALESGKNIKNKLLDTLLDWKDKDNAMRLNGAEINSYRVKKNKTYPYFY